MCRVPGPQAQNAIKVEMLKGLFGKLAGLVSVILLFMLRLQDHSSLCAVIRGILTKTWRHMGPLHLFGRPNAYYLK